jgi:hypothetical protein
LRPVLAVCLGGAVDAYRVVHFQSALGALHLDIFVGHKTGADPAIRRRKCLHVIADSTFIISLKILAD